MKITLDIGDVAFSVPATLPVCLPSGAPDSPSARFLPDYELPLSAFDSLTLDRLCYNFRNEVFRKANKEQPPEAAPLVVEQSPFVYQKALEKIIDAYDASSCPVEPELFGAIQEARDLL